MPFTYEEPVAQNKVNLDLIWPIDDSLESAADLRAQEIIAREIMDFLESALTEFSVILGHSRTSITHDIYTHALPEDSRRAVEELSKLIGS